jgi:hypothetical protein
MYFYHFSGKKTHLFRGFTGLSQHLLPHYQTSGSNRRISPAARVAAISISR